MPERDTITPDSARLEIRNVPSELLLYAVQQWLPCHKYTKKRVGNNTNVFIKGISVWLILKNETSSGNIQEYRSQLPELADKCKMGERTFRKYISWLKQEGLLHIQNGCLFLHDYRTLENLYGIDIRKREQTIFYDTTDKTTLAEILISLAITKLKEKWEKMYWKKLNQNQDMYSTLYDLLAEFGADPQQLSKDRDYFRLAHLALLLQSYNEERPGQPVFEFLHNHIKANPDLNARALTYANKFGYSAAMSFCHLKHRLAKRGLITIDKDHIQGQNRARKDEKVFHHRYLRDLKMTIWFRPDQIDVITLNFLQKNQAA